MAIGKANVSENKYDAQYSGLIHEQGTEVFDHDLNLLQDFNRKNFEYLMETFLSDGHIKDEPNALKIIQATSTTNNFAITKDSYFVGGKRFNLSANVDYTAQTYGYKNITVTTVGTNTLTFNHKKFVPSPSTGRDLIGFNLVITTGAYAGTYVIASNTATTVTVTGANFTTSGVVTGDLCTITPKALTTPGGARTDVVYLDCFEEEVNDYEDVTMKDTAFGYSSSHRYRNSCCVRVAENGSIPNNYSSGTNIHSYVQLATLSRIASAAIVTAYIADNRRYCSVSRNLDFIDTPNTYVATSGTANVYNVVDTTIDTYNTNHKMIVKIDVTNTGVSTLKLNALTAYPITYKGIQILPGQLVANYYYLFCLDGTSFQCLTPLKDIVILTTKGCSESYYSNYGTISNVVETASGILFGLLALCNVSYVARSTNQGQSFELTAINSNTSDIGMIIPCGTIGFMHGVGTGKNISRSLNLGGTTASVAQFSEYVGCMMTIPSNSSNAEQISLAIDNKECKKSTDSGATWTQVCADIGNAAVNYTMSGVSLSDTAFLVAMDNFNDVWKTANTGTSWTKTFSGTKGGSSPNMLFAKAGDYQASNTTIYFCLYNSSNKIEIEKSTNDSGATWSKIIEISDTANALGFCNILNATTFLLAKSNGVWISTDGCATWTLLYAITGITKMVRITRKRMLVYATVGTVTNVYEITTV